MSFTDDYLFKKCKNNLTVDSSELEDNFKNLSLERLSFFDYICFKCVVYRHSPNGGDDDILLVSDSEDFLANLQNSKNSLLSDYIFERGGDDSEENIFEKLDAKNQNCRNLLAVDFYSLFNQIDIRNAPMDIDYQFLLKEAQGLQDNVYICPFGTIEQAYDSLIFNIINENIQHPSHKTTAPLADEDFSEYIENLYNPDKHWAFMYFYTILDEIENDCLKNNSTFKQTPVYPPKYCICKCGINKCPNSVSLNSVQNTNMYYLAQSAKTQQSCEHNIRSLRHSLVHGKDKKAPIITRMRSIQYIEKDFQYIMAVVLSRIYDIS